MLYSIVWRKTDFLGSSPHAASKQNRTFAPPRGNGGQIDREIGKASYPKNSIIFGIKRAGGTVSLRSHLQMVEAVTPICSPTSL